MADCEFRTIVTPERVADRISHSSRIMMLGSCFSDSIGARLRQGMFNVRANPLGTLYNPLSITAAIDAFIDGRVVNEAELVESQGQYHSFLSHSSLSSYDKEVALARINGAIESAGSFLQTADWLIVTLGTSYVYKLLETGETVANCHKLSSKLFSREFLTVNQTSKTLSNMIGRLAEFNPKLRVIFTVSPIRHLADGAHENNLSKAALLMAVNQVINSPQPLTVCYFPSYEIMMDDLRDYRFYAADMVHPSETAVDYIYCRFLQAAVNEGDFAAIEECRKFSTLANHRPMTDNPESIRKLKESIAGKYSDLLRKYPYIELLNEEVL